MTKIEIPECCGDTDRIVIEICFVIAEPMNKYMRGVHN